MFFDENLEGPLRRGGLSFGSLPMSASTPTHTEDGVPIRKLYISRLPPNMTQSDLSKAFERFGEVEECQLVRHSARRGPAAVAASHLSSTHFAFVTFAHADAAHAALGACVAWAGPGPACGRRLLVKPAHSWHQPGPPRPPQPARPPAASAADTSDTEADDPTILDMLDHDCLQTIFGYLAFPELIRSERVSKRWYAAVCESIASLRRLSTAGWRPLVTTAVLRGALLRVGAELRELRIAASPREVNMRALPLVSRLCPRLERLDATGISVSMAVHGVFGDEAFEGFAHLSALRLSHCDYLFDNDLEPLLNRRNPPLLELRLESTQEVYGCCLSSAYADVAPLAIQALALIHTNQFMGRELSRCAPRLENLVRLRLDWLRDDCWRALPAFLNALPNPDCLRDLSLMYCTLEDSDLAGNLACAVSRCVALNRLRLACNSLATDETLKSASRAARDLEWLDVSGCHNVSESALVAALDRLRSLRVLDVSRASTPLDGVLAAASRLPRLSVLRVRDSRAVVADDLAAVVRASGALRELDARGTRAAEAGVVAAAIEAAEARHTTSPLELRLARSGFVCPLTADADEMPSSNRVRLDWSEERRPGCFERIDPSLQQDDDDSYSDYDDDDENDEDDDYYDYYEDIDDFEVNHADPDDLLEELLNVDIDGGIFLGIFHG